MTDNFNRHVLKLLRQLTNRPDSEFRDGQLGAIKGLGIDRDRVLVVQPTGWGRSAVYFLATRLLREKGARPTILISPLLALMRNQITTVTRMGTRAQLGSQIDVRRGRLARPGLSLAVLDLPAPAQRLAWRAKAIPDLPVSGIVYFL